MLRACTTARASSDDGSDDPIVESATTSAVDSGGRNRETKKSVVDFNVDDEASFVSALERADERRLEMEEKKLDLERRHFDMDCEEQKRTHEERQEERKCAAELDLQKMNVMMDVMSGIASQGGASVT